MWEPEAQAGSSDVAGPSGAEAHPCGVGGGRTAGCSACSRPAADAGSRSGPGMPSSGGSGSSSSRRGSRRHRRSVGEPPPGGGASAAADRCRPRVWRHRRRSCFGGWLLCALPALLLCLIQPAVAGSMLAAGAPPPPPDTSRLAYETSDGDELINRLSTFFQPGTLLGNSSGFDLGTTRYRHGFQSFRSQSLLQQAPATVKCLRHSQNSNDVLCSGSL